MVLAWSGWELASGANTTTYGILAVAGALGLAYAAWLGVAVDEAGLRIRRFPATRVVTWDDVEDIDCDVVAVHGLFGFYAPVLTVTGTAVVLRSLGSYRREVAEQRTRDLRVAATARAKLGAR